MGKALDYAGVDSGVWASVASADVTEEGRASFGFGLLDVVGDVVVAVVWKLVGLDEVGEGVVYMFGDGGAVPLPRPVRVDTGVGVERYVNVVWVGEVVVVSKGVGRRAGAVDGFFLFEVKAKGGSEGGVFDVEGLNRGTEEGAGRS